MKHSPRYRWQTRWHVDLDTQTARHESGLTVRYVHSVCGLAAVPDNPAETIAALAVKNGPGNAPIMLRRLIKEAMQIRVDAITRRDRYG